jgi:DNA (cytosine-5)-methyltransferase 1
MIVFDVFCGMGGASDGLSSAGLEVIGIEKDAIAAKNHELAGHFTVNTDATMVTELRTLDCGIWLSPPCQAFSTAGKSEGVKYKERLRDCIYREDWTGWDNVDPNIWLPLEVGRWTQMLQPRWVLCEQVVSAKELWEMYEIKFREWGFHTWSGLLNCADYGLPQTRKRAFFMASLDGPVEPPQPTHSKDGVNELLPWVTMQDCFEWEFGFIGFPRKADGLGPSIEINSELYRKRDLRPINQPSQTLTEKARSWLRFDIFNEKIMKLTIDEALVLQGFSPRQLVGSNTAKFRCIGNACPPVMAKTLAESVSRTQAPSVAV